MMEIVRDYPPIWDELNARFNIGFKPVIFAWGDIIYNPNGCDIDASLLAHEMVHGRQQGGDVTGWWRRYIDDPKFRLDQEIPAHQAEYIARMEMSRNRGERRQFEKLIAKRLSSGLYGGLVTTARARQLLKEVA